ncbi:hypothetical protein EUX58_07905 [Pseudomonas sp. 770NI]|nr:hypothetical protein EUX58_07905 [Pseudomonas sp. 770NI]
MLAPALLWEPGLPAMQTPRCSSNTELMLSQASQLPQKARHPHRLRMPSRLSSFQGYYHVPRPSLQLRVLPDQDRCWA